MNKAIHVRMISFGVVLGLLCGVTLVQAKSCCAYKLDTVLHQVNQLSQQVALLQSKTGCNALAITSAGEINAPGNYALANNIYGGIILNAPNISLDLCGHYIFPVDASATTRSATKRSVTGAVAADAGIWVTAEASGSSILNQIIGGGVDDFKIGAYIEADSVTVDGVKCFNSDYGFYSPVTQNCFFKNCWAAFFTVGGFYFENGTNNTCLTCKAVSGSNVCSSNCGQTVDLADVVGFHSVNSMNSFLGCSVEGVTAAAGSNAAAVRLVADAGSVVDGCIIDGVSSVDGAAHGIALQLSCNLFGQGCMSPVYGAPIHALSFLPVTAGKGFTRYFVLSGDRSNGAVAHLYQIREGLDGGIFLKQSLTGIAGQESFTNGWTASGNFFAVGGDSSVIIYSFNKATGSAAQVSPISFDPDTTVYSVAWWPAASGTKEYLAVTFQTFNASAKIRIYAFDTGTHAVTQIQEVAPFGNTYQFIRSLAWSFDGVYLAAAVQGSQSETTACLVYSFNASTHTLQSSPLNVGVTGGIDAHSVAWRPALYEGLYMLSLGGVTRRGNNFFVYQLYAGDQLQVLHTWSVPLLENVQSTVWSPDGQYVAAGASNNTQSIISLYSYGVIANNQKTLCSSIATGVGVDPVIDWAHNDGQFIIAGGGGDTGPACLFEVDTCANCVVRNNLVNGVATDVTTSAGVGIHADSSQNYVSNNQVLNAEQHYTGVASDLVTDQVNAIVAGNIRGGVSKAKDKLGTDIRKLTNLSGRPIYIWGNWGTIFSSLWEWKEVKNGENSSVRDIQVINKNPDELSEALVQTYFHTGNPNFVMIEPYSPRYGRNTPYIPACVLYDWNWAIRNFNGDGVICKCKCKDCTPSSCINLTMRTDFENFSDWSWDHAGCQ